jgi:hypothetical protein
LAHYLQNYAKTMPKHVPADLLLRVTAYLGERPGGRTLAELEALLEGVASRRTLQRRLDEWVRGGALRATGIRRGRRYFTAAPGVAESAPRREGSDIQASIPVSSHGREIQAQVRRPIADRAPVGYRREFLESYQPNQTTNLHALLADNLLDDPRHAGRGAAIADPFEQSFFLMVQLPYLQPFVDVNKRTSRLAANIPFIRDNLVPLSFIETVRDSLPEPDAFRLQYRSALIDVVGTAVRQRLPITEDALVGLARPLVTRQDLGPFIELALSELRELHDGNIARFRLRPAEFQAWREALSSR